MIDMRQGWEIKKLGELLEKTETVDPTKKPNAEFVYIDVSSVNKETKEIENVTVLMGKDAPSRARKLIRNGDVIFATVRPTHSRVALITEEYNEQVCSTGYFVLRGKEFIDNRLIFYFLLTDGFNIQMEKLQKGASYPAVTDSEVKNIFIPFPKLLTEQQTIVSILDEAFDAIAKAKANAEQNLKNSRELFESYLQSVFENGHGLWKMNTLEEISEVFGRGKSKHRPRNYEKLYGGDYPFIQTGDIRNCDHYITEYSQTYSALGLAQSKLWPAGTICITIAANIAETGVLTFDACFPDSVIGLVVNEKMADRDFVEYLLQSFKARIQALGKGSAQANINMGTFENELFPFPSVKEQRAIVQKLDALSTQTRKLESIYRQKIDDLEELKKSLLQKAFNGELKSPEGALATCDGHSPSNQIATLA